MFKYEILAPPSGHQGEMRMKGLVKPARGGSLEAWRPSRGKGQHLRSPLRDKELCVSFGFSCQPSPGQGSNNQDCAQGSNNQEMQNPLSRGRSILLTLGLHQDIFTKISLPRDQCRRLSQILPWGREALNPKGCRVAAQKLLPGLEAH